MSWARDFVDRAVMPADKRQARTFNEAGFSLLETLIAVFILALLASGGGVMLSSTIEGRRLIDERAAQLRALDLASSYLRQDIAAAQARFALPPGRFGDIESLHGGVLRGDALVLGLVRGGWTDLTGEAPRSDLFLVEYRYEDGTLSRRSIARPDATRATPAQEGVLLRGLDAFDINFRFLGQALPRWGNGIQGVQRPLPDAVEIELGFPNGEVLRQSFLVGGRL